MKLIKRLWLRLELMHAQHQVKHWSSEISAAATDDRVSPADVAYMMNCKADWIMAVDDIRCDLADLDAPDDDSEQLSNRAIPAPMYWHK